MYKYHVEFKDGKTTEIWADYYEVKEGCINFHLYEDHELIASVSDYLFAFVKKI